MTYLPEAKHSVLILQPRQQGQQMQRQRLQTDNRTQQQQQKCKHLGKLDAKPFKRNQPVMNYYKINIWELVPLSTLKLKSLSTG